MNIENTTVLAAIGAAGLSSCSLYDPNMVAAWEQPIPATPSALGEGEALKPAAEFADPADQAEAGLIALDRGDPIPVRHRTIDTSPVPLEALAAAPEAIQLPAPTPPPAPEMMQPPVIVAGSGTPNPGTIEKPESDSTVAEIRTEPFIQETPSAFDSPRLSLDPVFDTPPSLDYGVRLSEKSRPLTKE